jgi:hypothetical protein
VHGEAKRVLDEFLGSKTEAELGLSGLSTAIMLPPDPLHTNLGLLFDRKLDAIQQAAQDAGYGYDSAWLPWRHSSSEGFNTLADRQREAVLNLRPEGCRGSYCFASTSQQRRPKRRRRADSVVGGWCSLWASSRRLALTACSGRRQ